MNRSYSKTRHINSTNYLLEQKYLEDKRRTDLGVLVEQDIAGVSKEAVDAILDLTKQNIARYQGSMLPPLKQREIDAKFGAGTYQKFLDGGGKDMLLPKPKPKPTPIPIQEIPYPAGVSKEAVDVILDLTKQNIARYQGSMLPPLKQREIDAKFGAGTYQKFLDGGGKDVVNGKKKFKSTSETQSNWVTSNFGNVFDSEQSNSSNSNFANMFDTDTRGPIERMGTPVAQDTSNAETSTQSTTTSGGGFGTIYPNVFTSNVINTIRQKIGSSDTSPSLTQDDINKLYDAINK